MISYTLLSFYSSYPRKKSKYSKESLDLAWKRWRLISPRKLCEKVYGGEGGFYYARSPAELPKLKEGNIGGARLAFEKNVFALPAGSWKLLSRQVMEASFKVSPDVGQLFLAKRMDEEIFFPHPK
ncbi:hypothetical protein SADUNF_Sadunf10G0112500 [Salix dunnii]|uniref:Uncharacterized protein n=1 Tax=Salix dunnii TaxID=1413687 RepID=A0A835JTM0_9ROSI|nr:hypothetical protein SADUNF_Sadunf10G0112500 [Salix dunnii]